VTQAPRVRIEPFRTEGTSGDWTVRWRIINDGDRPIQLLSAQHPHSQFRTPITKLDREIRAGHKADLGLPVRFVEAPGVIVENPFLILTIREGAEWRLLARVRVTAGPHGEPLAGPSVVLTTQKVGASLSA
jgi:urease beta subunit